jgi:quercetin dioxygenase-like cupin family protein
LEGSIILQIENEARVCRVGDFIRIPRKAVHTGKALENGVRALAFSISYQEPGGVGYHPAELAEVEPKNL